MTDGDLTGTILKRAYEIWESEGRPHGRDRIHWLLAEAEICSGDRKSTAEPKSAERKSRSPSRPSVRNAKPRGR